MDRKVKRLDLDQIRYVYQYFMTKDFPDNERKPLAVIEKAVENQLYDAFGLFDGEEICGYAFFVKCIDEAKGADYLFDYFAIKKEWRSHGLGSLFIELLKKYFQDADSILGEVENPDYAESEDERTQQMRRLQFYQRNGMRDTGVAISLFGVEYRVLEYVLTDAHSREQIKEIYEKIYRSTLPEFLYQTKVKIHE